MNAKWYCKDCGREFEYTTAAIEHAAVHVETDIWPVYS